MATESGSYREGYFATIAAADTAIDSFLTAIDTRLNAVAGSQATRMIITVSLSVEAEDAGNNPYTHKMSFTSDTGVVAAGTALTNAQAMITALDTFADAIEAVSTYTTVTEVTVSANCTASC